MPRVALIGNAAAQLAPGLRDLGLEIDETGEFVLGVGEHAVDAFRRAADAGVAGVIGIDGAPPVADARDGRLRAPVLGIFAEADEGAAYSFAKALTEHGVLNETVVYDGVEPGFLGTHEQATADVWRLIRRFVGLPAQP